VDGMAIDTETAKRMQLWGRWGSSCGMGFYKDAFCDRNMIWDTYRPYLHDRPPQPWTLFGLNEARHHSRHSRHSRQHTQRSRPSRLARTARRPHLKHE